MNAKGLGRRKLLKKFGTRKSEERNRWINSPSQCGKRFGPAGLRVFSSRRK